MLLKERPEYYKNLTVRDLKGSFDLDSMFAQYQVIENHRVFDLYFIGQKAEDKNTKTQTLSVIDESAIRRIKGQTSLSHIVVRLPLRLVSAMIPEPRYQEFAYRYWKGLNSIQGRLFGSKFTRTS